MAIKFNHQDDFDQWKMKRPDDVNQVNMNRLEEQIQKRFIHLQNPKNCSQAKKLICDFQISCGYGCLIHHAVYCFILAYATQRMLIINSDNGHEAFFDQEVFKMFFQPLSVNCDQSDLISNQEMVTWGSQNADEAINVILHIAPMRPTSPFLPCSVPSDIADDLIKFHRHPCAWWVGQFVKYLLRPNANFASSLNSHLKDAFRQRPVGGIHIRRTDKAKEAKIHPVAEYAKHIAKNLESKNVFLASDDPKVFQEMREQWPNFAIFGDENFSRRASGLQKRKSVKSFYEFFITIFALAQSDFLVCTFSSNVCRLIYELRQCDDYNARNKTLSLDRGWGFIGGTNRDGTIIDFPKYH